MKENIPPKSFRLSTLTLQLLEALANELGISQTAVMTLAIREKSRRHKIQTPLRSIHMPDERYTIEVSHEELKDILHGLEHFVRNLGDFKEPIFRNERSKIEHLYIRLHEIYSQKE